MGTEERGLVSWGWVYEQRVRVRTGLDKLIGTTVLLAESLECLLPEIRKMTPFLVSRNFLQVS